MAILTIVKPTPRQRLFLQVAIVVLVLVNLGCAASSDSGDRPVPGPSPSVSGPSFGPDAITLAGLGIVNGPVDRVALPSDIRVVERVDQPNVVTLIVSAPAGPELIAFLGEQLPNGGFEVSAVSETGIVFAGFGWDGAATGGEPSGLTLRRRN